MKVCRVQVTALFCLMAWNGNVFVQNGCYVIDMNSLSLKVKGAALFCLMGRQKSVCVGQLSHVLFRHEF